MTVTQTPVAFLCIVMASVLFAACHPAAPVRTLDRPVRTAPATRVTLIAGTEPYAPATRPAHGEWPTRPVTIIVPFLPGGDTNMYARMFAPLLADILGQPIYVVNVDGDSGTIGASWVSAAAPDGYTMLFYHTGNLFANVLTGLSSVRSGAAGRQAARSADAMTMQRNVTGNLRLIFHIMPIADENDNCRSPMDR